MNTQPHVMTTYTFKDKDYLIKMNIINGNTLELCATDKYTAEAWNCTYDAAYIENLTHTTGNFKQFDIFIKMLKSGLLKMSNCITLDLLTLEELEELRSRKVMGRNFHTPHNIQANHTATDTNCRYLILTYTVEFDRIHYPLLMEYSGPPDPHILQGTIRRLEGEVTRLQEQLQQCNERKNAEAIAHISHLQKRIQGLTHENQMLASEVQYLKKTMVKKVMPSTGNEITELKNTVRLLEENVSRERSKFQRVMKQLQEDKMKLLKQVQELTAHKKILHSKTQHILKTGGETRPGIGRWPGDGKQLTSFRHPGDGIGSPGFKKEHLKRNIQSRSPSPSWSAKLQAQEKPHNLKPTNTDPKMNKLSKSHKYDYIPNSLARNNQHHRSSSGSSVGSKRSTKVQCNKVPIHLMHSTANVRLADDYIPMQTIFSRGRAREREKTKKKLVARSNSRSSGGSNSAKVKGIRSGSSRHSSTASSTASCCHHSDGSGDKVIKIAVSKKHRHNKRAALRSGVTDLERRIQALQKVLREGLNMT